MVLMILFITFRLGPVSHLDWLLDTYSMFRENRQLVTDEPVEFEK